MWRPKSQSGGSEADHTAHSSRPPSPVAGSSWPIPFLLIDGILAGDSIGKNPIFLIIIIFGSVAVGIFFKPTIFNQSTVGLFIILISVVLVTRRLQEIYENSPFSSPASIAALTFLISFVAFVRVEKSFGYMALNKIEKFMFPLGLAIGFIRGLTGHAPLKLYS